MTELEGASVNWLRRWSSFERLKRCAAQAPTVEARALLLAHAVGKWWFNSRDGSRSSHIEDLRRLREVLHTLQELGLGRDVPVSLEAAGQLLAFFENPAHFRMDGRMVRPTSAPELVRLQDNLKEARSAVANIAAVHQNI